MLFYKRIKSNSNRITNFSDSTMEFSKELRGSQTFLEELKNKGECMKQIIMFIL